jgi:hypothetical protein
MGSRRALGMIVTTTLAAAFALLGSPARADGYAVAYWPMNEAPGATQMIDSSGNGLHGRIGVEVGTGTVSGDDIGYRFARLEPDTPPARPAHLVYVADDKSLDPGTNDFAVTIRLRTTNKFGNIIQKGQSTVSGGNFKLQIPSGRVECTFRGPKAFLEVRAPYSINDGAWHIVRCVRAQTGVALFIDGQQVAAKAGWTGPIVNAWPITIGGKLNCDQIDVGCDYYAGDLDYITIEAARPEW